MILVISVSCHCNRDPIRRAKLFTFDLTIRESKTDKLMENPKPKLLKMRVFQLTQVHFAGAGITANLAIKSNRVNVKILNGFLIIGSSVACSLMYTFFEANTFAEYTQSIYAGSLAALIFTALAIIMFNVKKLFKLIKTCGRIVNMRELRIEIFQILRHNTQ